MLGINPPQHQMDERSNRDGIIDHAVIGQPRVRCGFVCMDGKDLRANVFQVGGHGLHGIVWVISGEVL